MMNSLLSDADVNLIIDMAWADEVSFDAIKAQTGQGEKQVIRLMRQHLKPASFRLWRSRVSGRKAKHNRRLRQDNTRQKQLHEGADQQG